MSTGFASKAIVSSGGKWSDNTPKNLPKNNYAEVKKGEIEELNEQLRKFINNRSDFEKTEVLKKIISSMTLGMDMSDLFNTIIMASRTPDLVQKKMIYLYLSQYAKENQEMTILAVNSILLDTKDSSPMIRGLALRWLCNMATPLLGEHMIDPLRDGLIDQSSYVRRAAVLSCAKLFRLDKSIGKDTTILNRLYELLRDKDSYVVINSLRALDEILQEEGGVVINNKIVLHLISMLKDFNEWGQIYVITLLKKYIPDSQDELFAIMNLLDSRCQHPNSALVLATIDLFLTLTSAYPEIHQHVYLRVKAPIMALLLRTNVETIYATLCHVSLISKRVPQLFASAYKFFFARETEPEYMKLTKVHVLECIATPQHAKEILTELSYYAMDHEHEFAKEAIRTIGRLAIKLPSCSGLALEILVGYLELEQIPHILETTIGVMKDMLRKFPSQAADVIPRLSQILDIITDPQAVAAAVYMIGSFGSILQESPYIIEEMVDNWDKQDAKVKNQLLVSSLKLFFVRPKEMKLTLGKLFQKGTNDFSNPDVHDKVLFYYRLLTSDVDTCKAIINSAKNFTIEKGFTENDVHDVDRLFEEFNTLSVVYCQTSDRFLKQFRKLHETQDEPTDSESFRLQQEEFAKRQAEREAQQLAAQQPQLQLSGDAFLDPPTFETHWVSLPVGVQFQTKCTSPRELSALDLALKGKKIKPIAKGVQGKDFKLFVFSQVVNGCFFFAELTISPERQLAQAVVKCQDHDSIPLYQEYLIKALESL